MALGYLSGALLVIVTILLVSAGIEDVRKREIANWKNGLIALLAPLWWFANGLSPWPDMALQVGVAALVMGVFMVAFHFGQMGGGDVKLIAALALWLPVTPLLAMLMAMAIIGGVLTILFMIDRFWRSSEGPVEIPYGVAIVIAALLTIREPFFNHFT